MREIGDNSVWDAVQAKAYAQNRHGVDGRKFLDPHIYDFMQPSYLEGQDVLDLGCGAGPWSLYAHQNKARQVTGLDINSAMTNQARLLLQQNYVNPNEASIVEGDVNALPENWNEKFSRILSVNVGCNLTDLRKHFSEAYRVASSGATMLVTAPNSLTTVFDDGETDGIYELLAVWKGLSDDQKDSVAAKKVISQLTHVHRATFQLLPEKELSLITSNLPIGTPILRRIPGLAVDNNFQTPEAYRNNATEAGWKITQENVSRFNDEAERQRFNDASETKLGDAYVMQPPFFVMNLQK